MKEKYICKTIPELAVCKTRESQPCKKEVETPDKDNRGWNMANTRWLAAEIPESCGRQFPGWLIVGTRGWLGIGPRRFVADTRGWNNAFTLIELLVVVLIIGILAAIAIPQYQVAVERSRATEGLTVLRSMVQANERYFMANGTYPPDITDLDIDIPGEAVSYQGMTRKETRYFLYGVAFNNNEPQLEHPQAFRLPIGTLYNLVWNNDMKKVRCIDFSSGKLGQKICQSLSGKVQPDGQSEISSNNYWYL